MGRAEGTLTWRLPAHLDPPRIRRQPVPPLRVRAIRRLVEPPQRRPAVVVPGIALRPLCLAPLRPLLVVVLVGQVRRAQLVQRLVDAQQGLPRRVTRPDAELPPYRLRLLGRVRGRESVRPPDGLVEAELTVARVRLQPPRRLLLRRLRPRARRLLDGVSPGRGLVRTRLCPFYKVSVVRGQAAGQDAHFALVRLGRGLSGAVRSSRRHGRHRARALFRRRRHWGHSA